MREFGRKSRLAALPPTGRLVYSVFLAFTLVGLGVSVWLGETIVGLTFQRFDEYYAGVAPSAGSAATSAESGGAEGGLVLDLPEEVTFVAEPEPKSFRSTLEVTHFHLFTMPIHWLVLAHLFALSGASERRKAVWIGASAFAMAAHLLAPWVARVGGNLAKTFYAGSGALLLVTFGWMAVVSLWEMWRRGPKDVKPAPNDAERS